ncbi:MAG TPA: phosphopentomutase [Thermoleophilaceae bacterium]|nr:phosphopentomutase [Thermoleophilaceae bacterium]
MARATVIVMDACGVGALPDAADYGDPPDANTLAHLAERVGGLDLPTLAALGLGNITSIEGVPPVPEPVVHGRLHPMGPGKESTTGHWELMGVVPQHPLPTYPRGFPPKVIEALERATGLRFCCNRPYSGTEVIEDFGRHHLDTGEVILYTSADSVLQLAAHVDVLPESRLYEACEAARHVMSGEHAVGRVIARPFEGRPGAFVRREGRRDYAAPPPGRSYLEELQDAGLPVHAVGKIRDLFAGVGITEKHDGATNAKGIASVTELLRSLETGFIFVNLVETDQVYGHRHDVEGFHGALKEIDAAVSRWLGMLRDDDLLILTADHGVDPNADHTDHTREHAPLLASFPGGDGRRHDGPLGDVGASVLRWLTGRDAPALAGNSFLASP